MVRANPAALLFLSLFLLCPAFAGEHIVLVTDPAFALGAMTRKAREKPPSVIRWKPGDEKPVWTVAEWHAKGDITDPAGRRKGAWDFKYEDDYKTFVVNAKEAGADLIMGVNAINDYGGSYRGQGDPWPHLLVQQRISNPRGHLGASSPSMAQLQRIDFSCTVRLVRAKHVIEEGYIKNRHAAQFLIFFTVQNLNPQSPGRGDYLWFGICFYDSRHPVTKKHVMFDMGSEKKQGTGKLIYNVGMEPFTDKEIADGEWITVRGDLYPMMIQALNEAWKRGALPASRNLDDYYIGGMNLGWEVTGLSDVAMAVRDLSVVGEKRSQPAEVKDAGVY